MTRGAAYIRVSTLDQAEFSPDAQKRAIFEYAKRNNIFIEESNIFIDEGISGRKAEKRPAFMQMIKMAKLKDKPFEVIIVHRFDRFSRNREDSVVYKSLLRKEYNIKVISVTEQLEDDKFSIILEAMLEAMAEYYSLNLADEVKKGMAEKAKRGGFQAQPPIGYEIKEKGNPPVIVEKEAEIVKFVFEKYLNENYEIGQIGRQLNEMGYRTVNSNYFETRGIKYILENPIYSGFNRWNYRNKSKINDKSEWIIAKGDHEAIISKEVFDKVQKKINNNVKVSKPKKRPNTEYKHWLSGIMKCNYCKGAMTYCNTNGITYFRCNKKLKGSCTESNYIRGSKIEEIVLEKIKYDMNNVKYILKDVEIQEDNYEVDMLKSKLSQLQKRMSRIKESYIAGIDTMEEYKVNKQMIEKESINIEDKLNVFKLNSDNTETLKDKFLSVYQYLSNEKISFLERNKALKSIVKAIYLDNKNKEMKIQYYLNKDATDVFSK